MTEGYKRGKRKLATHNTALPSIYNTLWKMKYECCYISSIRSVAYYGYYPVDNFLRIRLQSKKTRKQQNYKMRLYPFWVTKEGLDALMETRHWKWHEREELF